MRKKIVGIFVCMFLISIIIPIPSNATNTYNPLNGGWLEERDGVKILHISGSNYEMGYQYGYLLKEESQQNLRAFLDSSSISYEELLGIWNIMKNYMPQKYIEELQGMADGADVSFEDIAAAYMLIVHGDMGCFGISAWGPATVDGKLYHLRSFDFPFDIKDPITGKFVHENNVLIVRNPDEGFASLCPSVAGIMHGGGGINEKGIALGMQVCWNKDQTFHGIPTIFRTLMVLDEASTGEEAVDILTNDRTLGWNFVLSDAKVPAAYAVEVCGSHYYVGTYDHPTESNTPFWSIDHVIRRTNFFIDPTVASTQRDYYNIAGLASFFRLAIYRSDVFFAIWRSYRAMSKDIENNWGTIDLNNLMSMFRAGYKGETDPFLKLIVRLADGTSFNRAWNIWAADPENGDMLVCFASHDKIAYDNPVHSFNMYELLDSSPP